MKFRVAFLVVAGIAIAVICLQYRAQPDGPSQVVPQTVHTQEANKLAVSNYAPPVINDRRLSGIVNRNAPVSNRISSDIASRISSVTESGDLEALAAVLKDDADDDTVRNEVASLLARSNYIGLADALISVLENAHEKARFRAFATQHLGGLVLPNDIDLKKRVNDKLHALLADKDVEIRRESLLALVRRHDPGIRETVVQWLTSDARDKEEVRDLAIRCAHDLDLREHITVIRQLTNDPGEAVRIAAIVALSQWRDEESRPVFEKAAASTVARLQRAGRAALERLDSKN